MLILLTFRVSGFLGGGQVGCNLQFGVIGIEGDGSGSDIRGDITQTVLGITGTAHAQTDWIASATGRLGWAWDRWLLYAKGGAAWAGDKYSAFIPVFNEQLEASETRPAIDLREYFRSYSYSGWAHRRSIICPRVRVTFAFYLSGHWSAFLCAFSNT
jgi:hypothetical protein